MKIFKNKSAHDEAIVEFFTPETSGLEKVEIGSSLMKGHSESNWSSHQGDEYSYFVKGKVTVYAKNGEETEVYHVDAGDAICTPAGQVHKSVNESDEDCLVIWIEVAK